MRGEASFNSGAFLPLSPGSSQIYRLSGFFKNDTFMVIKGGIFLKLVNSFLLVPLLSVLVLPTGWVEGRLLPKATWAAWAAILVLVNATLLYFPWVIAITATRHIMVGPLTVLGFFMVAVGLFLLATALSLIIRVPGQMRTLPERLVVEGPYRLIRHPIYLSHFLLIGGSALAFGALKVFLEVPVLLGIAAIGAKYEESRRLLPLFGKTFEQYKAKTHFLLPTWGWVILGFLYSLVALSVVLS
jgi:protein-S-isoprenylcysteine O-methyltransferase Ste14